MTKYLSLSLACVGFLAACASAAPYKEGGTAAELADETGRCAAQARTRLPEGDPSMSDAVSLETEQAMRRQTFVRKCLHAKGWR